MRMEFFRKEDGILVGSKHPKGVFLSRPTPGKIIRE